MPSKKSKWTQGPLLYKSLVVVFGFIALIALTFLILLPIWDEFDQKQTALNNAKDQLKLTQMIYTEEKISDEQINDLLLMLPVQKRDSQNLVALVTLAGLSKAPVMSFTQGGIGDGEGAAEEAAQGTASVNNQLATSTYEVKVAGHLENLLLYLNNIQQYKQLFAVEKWTIKEVKSEDVENEYPNIYKEYAYLQPSKPLLSMELTIQSYTIPSFLSAFDLDQEPAA